MLVLAAALLGAFGSNVGSAFAQSSDELLSRVAGNGPYQVTRMSVGNATLYVPRARTPGEQFNVLGWGNGTGAGAGSYRSLLTSIASHGIVVAAANTGSSGSGVDVQNAVQAAIQNLGAAIKPAPRVCTSGHSQGGGGAFNAANLLRADCVIPVQPDTRFTARIQRPLASATEVICLTSTGDRLAPKASNERNVERNTPGPLVEVQTTGQSHLAPVFRSGGRIGDVFRAAAIAELASDGRSAEYRRLFWGSQTGTTINANTSGIEVVERNAAAVSATP